MLTTSGASAENEVKLEWKVEVGDSITRIYEKYFDANDWDDNGDPNSRVIEIEDEDGNMHNITFKKGLRIKLEVTALNDHATIQWIVNNIARKPIQDGGVSYDKGIYVRKTVDNKTYWEDQTVMITNENENVSVSIEGNFKVSNINITLEGETTQMVSKFNWKTGWWTYSSTKRWNSSGTISEIIYSTDSGDGIPGFEFVPLLVSMIVLTIITSKKRIK